jgi:excisionase family DNA binding protein
MLTMSAETPDLLTTLEAAKMLRVGRSTLLRWIQLDQIKAVRLPSGQYRVPREEIDRLLREARREK